MILAVLSCPISTRVFLEEQECLIAGPPLLAVTRPIIVATPPPIASDAATLCSCPCQWYAYGADVLIWMELTRVSLDASFSRCGSHVQVIKLVKEEEDAQAKEGGDGGRGEHSTHSHPLFDDTSWQSGLSWLGLTVLVQVVWMRGGSCETFARSFAALLHVCHPALPPQCWLIG